ncbi:MAG: Uma2 family endonuclease [Candidatus Kapaibacterium sp.]|nr:MAG: Uma2 family endonuclease [Candidatus Kapabacteria bacterium]
MTLSNTSTDALLEEEYRYENRIVRRGATREEYLEFENTNKERHEFHNGDIIAMPGNTGYHEELNAEIIAVLLAQLRGRAKVFASNLKTMIPTYNRYVYPDVTVVRGEAEYNDAGKRELLNPTVIIEVLSPSTADFDLTRKFEYYRSIPSLEEVAYFEPEQAFVQLFRKNAHGRWEIIELENGVVEFASVQAHISLAEIYPKA